ncbi:MAG: type II toxin-antitoxin system VapC family toxin [Candidatus Riflebacteria bacterium]
MVKPKYLLDTNILSELIKQPQGYAAQKIASLKNADSCCTSVIVACELRYGACKKGSHTLSAKVDQLLETIVILPLGQEVELHYARLRVALERTGTPIGSNDLLIASQASALGLTIITGNVKEFARIPDLAVENWLRESPPD